MIVLIYHHRSIDRSMDQNSSTFFFFLRDRVIHSFQERQFLRVFTLCHLSSDTNMQRVKTVNIPCSSTEVITTHRRSHILLYSLNGSLHRMCEDNHHVATPPLRMNESDLKNNFKPLNHLVTTSFLLIESL